MAITTANPETKPVGRLKTTTKMVLIVEYDGTRYHGFQLQASLPTIQGEIEEALGKLTGERTRVLAASRTDVGVHARGQVVSFRTGSSHAPRTFVNGLNYYLPRDIAVNAAYRARDAFNVRRHATSREYHYYILNRRTRSPLRAGFAYLLPEPLDTDAMNQAAQTLIGEHDLASFASSIEDRLQSTVRRVYRAEIKRDGELVVFKVVASSFLPHQVRNTVGTLLRVGLGKMNCDEFCGIMERKEPGLAGPTAPAGGLCLMQVNYPSPFEDDVC